MTRPTFFGVDNSSDRCYMSQFLCLSVFISCRGLANMFLHAHAIFVSYECVELDLLSSSYFHIFSMPVTFPVPFALRHKRPCGVVSAVRCCFKWFLAFWCAHLSNLQLSKPLTFCWSLQVYFRIMPVLRTAHLEGQEEDLVVLRKLRDATKERLQAVNRGVPVEYQ